MPLPPIGNTYISFKMDGQTIETAYDLRKTVTSLPTVLVVNAPSRQNTNFEIGFGMRATHLDSIQVPYTFTSGFGFVLPNADIFYKIKENDRYYLYSIESGAEDVEIKITAIDSSIIKGVFSGAILQFESDERYNSRKLVGEKTIIDGKFVVEYR